MSTNWGYLTSIEKLLPLELITENWLANGEILSKKRVMGLYFKTGSYRSIFFFIILAVNKLNRLCGETLVSWELMPSWIFVSLFLAIFFCCCDVLAVLDKLFAGFIIILPEYLCHILAISIHFFEQIHCALWNLKSGLPKLKCFPPARCFFNTSSCFSFNTHPYLLIKHITQWDCPFRHGICFEELF